MQWPRCGRSADSARPGVPVPGGAGAGVRTSVPVPSTPRGGECRPIVRRSQLKEAPRTHRPKTRCRCRGGHLCAHRTSRRHRPKGKIKQSLRRAMTSKVNIGGRLAEDLHNSLIDTHVRDVRHRGNPVELRRPLAISCQAPGRESR